MSKRFFILCVCAVVLAAAVTPAAGQAARANSAGTSTAAAEKFTPPRLPDGRPNLQGLWSRRGGNLEREDSDIPNPLIVPRLSSLEDDRPNGTTAVYPTIYTARIADTRTEEQKQRQQRAAEARKKLNLKVGIIDPANGKIPAFTPAALAAREKFYKHMPNPPTLEYVEWSARCGLDGFPQTAGTARFVQRPDALTMFFEGERVLRTIALDGRPHVGQNIRLYNGDSVGKWEGDTLVVDITNFNGKTWWNRSMPMLSDKVHVTERYTMVDADTIAFESTLRDPEIFVQPIKVAGYYIRAEEDDFPLENACAEGLQTIENIMTRPDGSRLRVKP